MGWGVILILMIFGPKAIAFILFCCWMASQAGPPIYALPISQPVKRVDDGDDGEETKQYYALI